METFPKTIYASPNDKQFFLEEAVANIIEANPSAEKTPETLRTIADVRAAWDMDETEERHAQREKKRDAQREKQEKENRENEERAEKKRQQKERPKQRYDRYDYHNYGEQYKPRDDAYGSRHHRNQQPQQQSRASVPKPTKPIPTELKKLEGSAHGECNLYNADGILRDLRVLREHYGNNEVLAYAKGLIGLSINESFNKKAYKELSMIIHPDKSKCDHDIFAIIGDARDKSNMSGGNANVDVMLLSSWSVMCAVTLFVSFLA
jgi:hypothetical protein